ncbi:glycosyltransferase family 4 protein [Cellulomonas humilata]|uniref:Glycosyltransferase involved in cell wall biosynthesis n=1 Tax=Cellulomonas humilata TaxID=144055 RepID=A0ABU0EDU9_9CELL|nr:glycosyltransferase family 1 protein [Cellulomonas humilata]MDQ0373240.1 glycosyltransferase involved in cell wall biosynthesis [Cellulomonas humilata]
MPPTEPTHLRVAMTVEQLWQPFPGGSGTYVRSLATSLAGTDDVDVVGVAARHTTPPPSGDLPIPVRTSWLPRRVLYDAWHTTRRPRSSVPRDADVVHATTWAIPPRTAPLVVTVHDLAFLRAPEHFTPRGNRFFRRALEIVGAEADVVLTPSELTALDCVDHGIERARLRVVPLAADVLDVPTTTLAEFQRAHGLSERPYVLWCGTVEPRKNLPTLLRAFGDVAARSDLDLVLVGPVGWGSVDLEAPAAVLGDRLKVLGRLSHADLHAAYAGARAFAFPSTWEGFGLPVLEAMGHGVPVVTSRGTSMAEFAADSALLVDPLDSDALAEALLDASGPQHDDLAVRGLAVAERHTWARTAEQTVAAYRAVR